MKSSKRRRTASAASTPASDRAPAVHPGELHWSHLGVRYRVTPWPDVSFEVEQEGTWCPCEPADDALASGALGLGAVTWRRYLEFMPARDRQFLNLFTFGRLPALRVISACPELMETLQENPALTAFIAGHRNLRGTGGPRWSEVRAVHERGGVFGLLEWLGLPATRDTLDALSHLIAPDVPRRLLEPLRTGLWSPATRAALQRTPAVSDRDLAHYCHALAA